MNVCDCRADQQGGLEGSEAESDREESLAATTQAGMHVLWGTLGKWAYGMDGWCFLPWRWIFSPVEWG